MEFNSKSLMITLVVIVLIFRLIQTWLAHRQANRNLDVLKSYIDQGKEPPAELLQYLRSPLPGRMERGPSNSYFSAILVAGVAAAFALIAFLENEPHIYFMVIILGAVALGMLVRGLMQQSSENRHSQP